jgi:glycosyltransferase involved in cell wall biosynthesis
LPATSDTVAAESRSPGAANALRIVQVVPSLAPARGGPSRSVPDLCRALSAAGVDVTLLALWNSREGATLNRNSERFDVRFVTAAFGSAQFPSLRFVTALQDACRRADVIHIHSLWNPVATITASVARRLGVPYVISPRGMLQQTSMSRRPFKKALYYMLFERRTVAGAAALHFLSDAERHDSGVINPARQMTIVAPNGVDGNLAATEGAGVFRRGLGLGPGKRLMLFLGRLHWSKGLDLQADAFIRIARRMDDVVWVLVGKDEGVGGTIRQRLAHAGLMDRVWFTGELQRDQCLSALRDADVFVLSSRHEAHSMALNEAMVLGAPCVITRSVGFKWLGEYGAGVETENTAEALADGICDVLQSRIATSRRVEAARRLVTDKLSWSRVAAEMVRGYNAVLVGR